MHQTICMNDHLQAFVGWQHQFVICARLGMYLDVYMGKAPASSSTLQTPFTFCVCIIVWMTCVCMDEAPVAMNMLCVWLHVWHPYAWVMRLGESACYEICPHILHVWCVCVYAESRSMRACRRCDASLEWLNLYLGTIQASVCVYYLHIQLPESIQGFWVV